MDNMDNIIFKPDKPVGCPSHSIESHNFHIRRFGKCLYCNAGSVAVPKCMIEVEDAL